MPEGLIRLAPLIAGPLVIAGFFLPWTHGDGPFRFETYSGYELVALATTLQRLDVAARYDVALLLIRGLLLALLVAAVWLTVLAPAYRWHWGYRFAAAYVVVGGIALALVSIARSGDPVPSLGLGLILIAALILLAARVEEGLQNRRRRASPVTSRCNEA